MIRVDLLVRNIRQLVNPAADQEVRGRELNRLRLLENGWVAARGEEIVFIGREEDFLRQCQLDEDAVVIDAGEMIALPGFVDPHTHLPFAGTRQDEFNEKLQGVSYQEIAARGGGIKGSVRKTRAIATAELTAVCEKRLDLILQSGTTTLEAKSGYGLNREAETKQLEVLEALNSMHPVEIVPTFMGAHEIPEEYAGRSGQFLDMLAREVAPAVREKGLAEFADIFCEEGYFSCAEADEYLGRMADLGFKLKIHADEFTSNGAAFLAAARGARSAEHLIAVTDEEIAALAASPTTAVLLPGVSFFLRLGKYAPVRKMLEQNAIVALGSDFNPGSSMISSQLFIFYLAVFQMGLTIAEALNMITINAAYAIDRQRRVGSLALGKKMDMLLLDIPDYEYLAYHPGIQPIHTVIKAGEVVVNDRRIVFKE